MVIDLRTFDSVKETKTMSIESFRGNEAKSLDFFPCFHYIPYLTRRLVPGEMGIMHSESPYIVIIKL